MVDSLSVENDKARFLLELPSNGDRSWRLNFDEFQLTPEQKEKKPPRSGYHTCLGVYGPGDNVADYYQQQVKMLEEFTEMDALAERGFIPEMSKVGVIMVS